MAYLKKILTCYLSKITRERSEEISGQALDFFRVFRIISPKSIVNFFPFFLFFLGISYNCFATKQITEVNYFASLRANETNIRSGPGANYPIKFNFRLKGLPVKVVSEYDNWNEIEDFEGQKGWVNQSLISKKRNLMIQTKKKIVSLFSKNDEKSRILLYLENFVIGDYLGCIEDWCNMKVENKKGWVKRSEVFGSDAPTEDEPIEEEE